jgi:hypothetical protein
MDHVGNREPRMAQALRDPGQSDHHDAGEKTTTWDWSITPQSCVQGCPHWKPGNKPLGPSAESACEPAPLC